MCIFGIFFQLQKREINDIGGYLCQAGSNVRGGGGGFLRSFAMERNGGGWMGQKTSILAWRNYWTAPKCELKKVLKTQQTESYFFNVFIKADMS